MSDIAREGAKRALICLDDVRQVGIGNDIIGDVRLRRSLAGVPLWAWLLGLAGACVVMGPALAPGSLLNLDLVLVPDPPIPRGAWGLGPELPRRVPMWIPVAWLSAVFGGGVVGKAIMVAGIAVAFAGMFRLASRSGTIGSIAAATLYALGPFLVTRLAVGHLMIVWTMALLPWALPDLLAPNRAVYRTFIWSAAIGFTSSYGAVVAGVVIVAGLINQRGRRLFAITGVFLLAQLPWLVPLAVVASSGIAIADAGAFPSEVLGLKGIGELLAGHGFWNPPFQVGWPSGWHVALLGFALLFLAAFGTRDLPAAWRLPLVGLATVGFMVSASSGVPGLDALVVRLSRTPFGAPLRETQRLLPLYLLWMAPSAALGAKRLATAISQKSMVTSLAAMPLVAALLLGAPGLWGAGGQLRPLHFPAEWAQARDVVRDGPGSVVAFPWYHYFTFDVADNRLVLNTVPLYFGGDVIVSSDPLIGGGDGSAPVRERGDKREAEVAALVDRVKEGQEISGDLARLGVRWVVLMKDVDWSKYEPGLTADDGLEVLMTGNSLVLYRVKNWAGVVVDSDGLAVETNQLFPAFANVAPSGAARAAIPGSGGWLRGMSGVAQTHDGLLALPPGSGLLWYWPSALVLIADAAWVSALVSVAVRRYRVSVSVRRRSAMA